MDSTAVAPAVMLATRIRSRAIRRAGELLREVRKATGDHLPNVKRAAGVPLGRQVAATRAGLSERQRKTALRVAAVDSDQFEAAVEADKPATIPQLAKAGTKPAPRPKIGPEHDDPVRFARSTEGQGSPRVLYQTAQKLDPKDVIRGASAQEKPIIKDRATACMAWLKILIREIRKSETADRGHPKTAVEVALC